MENGRLAGVDFGSKRIGISISDPSRKIASPFCNYTRTTRDQEAQYFRRLADEEQITAFVVGLPIYPSGDESPQSKAARKFGQWLSEVTCRPVHYFDERHTTQLADELMHMTHLSRQQRKARRDKIAAQVLLAAYLESDRSREHVSEPLDGE